MVFLANYCMFLFVVNACFNTFGINYILIPLSGSIEIHMFTGC
jgi:hypothetical protein